MIQSDIILKNINIKQCENLKRSFLICMKEKPSSVKIKNCKSIFDKYLNMCQEKQS